MTPDWKIGPVARRRLVEMAKDGWNDQVVGHDGSAENGVYVRLYRPGHIHANAFIGVGNTIGLAVAGAYKDWKKHKGKT